MNARTCPSCRRQFDDTFQFCPYDASPLGRNCPKCGRAWEGNFQFCPLDGAPLGGEAPAAAIAPPPLVPAPPARLAEPEQQPPPAPPPHPAPPAVSPAAPPPVALHAPPPAAFASFDQAVEKRRIRPALIVFIVGVIAVGLAVWFLMRTTGGGLPLPTVSFAAVPSDGKAKGTAVVIKLDQLALFLIDDPAAPSSPDSRTSQIVGALTRSVQRAKQTSEVRYRVERFQGAPVIFETDEAKTGDSNTLVTITDGDLTLAGETDGLRLASQWAERLTDAVRIYVFGDPPTFSRGTAFGEALVAMYKEAAAANRKVSKRSLDGSFQKLSPARRRALESPPVVAGAPGS